MMNLWAFLLLGVLAQTSHGCVQNSFKEIEDKMKLKFTGIFNDLKGSTLPDGKSGTSETCKQIKLKKVEIIVTTKCSTEGKMIMKATGTFIISSDIFSNRQYNMSLNMEILPSDNEGHLRCEINYESFVLTIELAEGQEIVDKSIDEHCTSAVKAMCTGAVNSGITSMNQQHAKLTEEFQCVGYKCKYKMGNYSLFEETMMTNIIMSCDGVGPLNDGSGLTINSLQPDESSAIYFEQSLCSNVFAIVPICYKKILTKSELNGAFKHCKGDVSIAFKTASSPKALISAGRATAEFSLEGSIDDESGNLLCFAVKYRGGFETHIINGLITVSFGEMSCDEMTLPSDATDEHKKSLEHLKITINYHVTQALKDYGCKMPSFKVPQLFGMGISPRNAKCSPQPKQMYCVQKKQK